MTDVEQFLADLEDKAKAATNQGEWQVDGVRFAHGCAIRDANHNRVIDDGSAGGEYAETTTMENMDHIAAANPAAVLRLVGMVREIADCAAYDCPYGCPPEYAFCLGDCAICWLTHAYNATEGRHD